MTVLALFVAVGAAGCGGGSETTPPATTATPAPSASTPKAPEPPKELPATVFPELHGAPAPTESDRRELYDVSRDLLGIAAGDAGAPSDFAVDLRRYLPTEGAASDGRGLADALTAALKGKSLDEATAQRLTGALYVSLHGDDMNKSQRAAAAGQLQTILTKVGVAKPQADAVIAQLPQSAVR